MLLREPSELPRERRVEFVRDLDRLEKCDEDLRRGRGVRDMIWTMSGLSAPSRVLLSQAREAAEGACEEVVCA